MATNTRKLHRLMLSKLMHTIWHDTMQTDCAYVRSYPPNFEPRNRKFVHNAIRTVVYD